MKLKLILTSLFTSFFCLLSSQVPQGFNYQAIARDASGNPIVNQKLPVRITIRSDSLRGTIFWQEVHPFIQTNEFGLITLVVGKGTRQKTSILDTFSAIDWKVTPKFIETEIDDGSGFILMGSTRLWAIPYAMVADSLGGPLKKLKVSAASNSTLEEILFEVKNRTGQTVFAVYNEGVRIFVDDGAKEAKGGFSVGGFGTAKAPSQEYLRVTRDSTRIYVNQNAKPAKGGFSVGGFGAKGSADFLNLTPENYFIGHNSGLKNTTGIYNSFFGYESGYSNTTGRKNVFFGYRSGYSNDTASYNVYIGNEAGRTNRFGRYNVYLGFESGYTSDNADYNTFIGYQSGKYNTYGDGNLFMGYTAGLNNTSGYRNVFLGYNSGKYNVSGYENTFVGGHAGYGFNTGNANIMVGTYSGNYFYGGNNNIFIGNGSGYGIKNTTTLADNNIFIGSSAGRLITTGVDNAFIGTESGFSNSTGSYNASMGYTAGRSNTTGSNNLFIGNAAGYANTSGNYNTFLGFEAGYSSGGSSFSTSVGYKAGHSLSDWQAGTYLGYESGVNSTGRQNVFLGAETGNGFTTGADNVVIGAGAGSSPVSPFVAGTGSRNTFVGYYSGYKSAGATDNVIVGAQNPFSATSITGSYNVYLGVDAGNLNSTGSNNVFIGYQAGSGSTGISNSLIIENSNATTPLIGGDFLNNRVGINRNPGSYTLEVGGTVMATGNVTAASFSLLSDARYKSAITPLQNALEDILMIKGVRFNWKRDEFKDLNFPEGTQIGVIAQDVEKIFPELVFTGPDGYKSVSYEKLTPVLVEAVKEQQKIIESQNEKLNNLDSRLKEQQSEIDKLRKLISSSVEVER